MSFVAILVCAVCAVTWWLTGQMRRYASAHGLLDVPNSRSSHAVATLRGSGVAMILATVGAWLVLGFSGWLGWPTVWGLSGGGVIVGAIGFVDDHGHVAPRWRILGHIAGAVWVLAWFGGPPPLCVFGTVCNLGWFGHVLAVLYLVWVLNLTNFMDGIDAIAGVETVTVCLSAAWLLHLASPDSLQWTAPVVVASASVGFLIWNWPPAKVFMGDVGSGFLGLTLAALSLTAARVSPRLFWSWIILLGVFVVDATVTLLHRAISRERLFEAHRSHAYQHAAHRAGSHLSVTLVVGAINLCWLLPWAGLVASGRGDGLVCVVIAYIPLAVAVTVLRAGTPSQS